MSLRREQILSLESKAGISKIVIQDALTKYLRPAIVLDGSKEGIAVTHLVKSVVESIARKMPPAIFVDHGDHFPETPGFLGKIAKDWNFNLITARNDNALDNAKNDIIFVSSLNKENRKEIHLLGFSGEFFQSSSESDVRNHLLKRVALISAIKRYRFDSIITGIRWDSGPEAGDELFISDKGTHVQVSPILPFLESDVWQYTLQLNLPIHPRYAQGYPSIEGIHSSQKVSDIPAWEQKTGSAGKSDMQTQNREAMAEKLRALGYS